MDTGWKYFKNKSSHSSKQDRQWQTVHAQIQFTLKYIIVSRKENLLHIRKIKCVKMMTAFIISSNLHKLAKFLHFRNHWVIIVGRNNFSGNITPSFVKLYLYDKQRTAEVANGTARNIQKEIIWNTVNSTKA